MSCSTWMCTMLLLVANKSRNQLSWINRSYWPGLRAMSSVCRKIWNLCNKNKNNIQKNTRAGIRKNWLPKLMKKTGWKKTYLHNEMSSWGWDWISSAANWYKRFGCSLPYVQIRNSCTVKKSKMHSVSHTPPNEKPKIDKNKNKYIYIYKRK